MKLFLLFKNIKISNKNIPIYVLIAIFINSQLTFADIIEDETENIELDVTESDLNLLNDIENDLSEFDDDFILDDNIYLDEDINSDDNLLDSVLDADEEILQDELIEIAEPESDIEGHWAEDIINEWLEEGLLSGFPDGTIRPDNGVTRAEFVYMLQNVFKLRATAPAEFSDVRPTAWYYDAVAAAFSSGVASGMADGTFKPDDYVTRGQAAVFGFNAMGLSGIGSLNYTDAEDIPDWCNEAIGNLTDHGFLSGMPDGRFAYSNLLTRGEAVSFLDRMRKYNTSQEIVSTESTTEYTYAIEEKNAVITGQELNGDLIITPLIGDNNVTLDNVTVNGNLIIQGGGLESILLKDTTISGTIVVDYENVGIIFSGDTSCEKIQVNTACSLNASNDYNNQIDIIYFPYEINPVKNRTKINIKATQVIANAKVYIELGAFVDKLTFNKASGESKLQLTKTGIINTLICNSRIDITGSGEIRNLQANESGITQASSLSIKNINLATGVDVVDLILSSVSK